MNDVTHGMFGGGDRGARGEIIDLLREIDAWLLEIPGAQRVPRPVQFGRQTEVDHWLGRFGGDGAAVIRELKEKLAGLPAKVPTHHPEPMVYCLDRAPDGDGNRLVYISDSRTVRELGRVLAAEGRIETTLVDDPMMGGAGRLVTLAAAEISAIFHTDFLYGNYDGYFPSADDAREGRLDGLGYHGVLADDWTVVRHFRPADGPFWVDQEAAGLATDHHGNPI